MDKKNIKNDSVSGESIPNILIVDDIAANLKVLGEILKSYGYKVRPVPNGRLALEVAEKEKPDLILLDIMMPEMDGFEVCRRLKEKESLREIPVIFISALNDTSDIVNAFTAGGVDYITKPFNAEEVKARVATHIQICRQNQILKDQSRQLKDLMNTKDKLFSIISHDLRSPFTVLIWFSEMLMEKAGKLDKEKIVELSTDINSVSTATLVLLDNLLQWARIQQGLLVPVLRKINLKDIAFGISILSEENAKSKDIVLKNNINKDVFAYGDMEMTKVVLRNLISNALKFTKKEGSISIDVFERDAFIEIKVADNGTGISSERIPYLFKIDRNTSTVGTADEKGSGLGLMLCKELIEMQGGSIWLESEMGKGSVFSISLPKNQS